MRPLIDGAKEDYYNWTFVINDKPMFIKGTGWCTMDALMDFSRNKYEHFTPNSPKPAHTNAKSLGRGNARN